MCAGVDPLLDRPLYFANRAHEAPCLLIRPEQ
jgi:hypothetical protein